MSKSSSFSYCSIDPGVVSGRCYESCFALFLSSLRVVVLTLSLMLVSPHLPFLDTCSLSMLSLLCISISFLVLWSIC